MVTTIRMETMRKVPLDNTMVLIETATMEEKNRVAGRVAVQELEALSGERSIPGVWSSSTRPGPGPT
jgi:hypothetical protein